LDEPRAPLSRTDAGAAAALALGLLAVYACGACRTIYVGDSGELVTAVYLLGIPHPSGYPLYALLGKIWTLLVPIGSIAFRMSLFSAAAAATACAALYVLSRRFALTRVSSLFAALLLAFGPSFWGEAGIQRTYSLSALFLIAATIAAHAWFERRGAGRLAIAFLLAGLGASVHLFMAVWAICLGLFVLFVERPLALKARSAVVASVSFLTGLVPYVYLPIRSRADPALDWGNPETLHNFLRVVFREDFWDRKWYESPRDLPTIGWDWLSSFGPELAWLGALLAAAGIAAAFRRRLTFVLLPVAVMLANVTMLALHGSRSDIFIWHRYYISSYAMAALLAAIGADALAALAPVAGIPSRARAALLLVPLALVVSGWREFDRSRYRIAEDFSSTVLRSLPPGSHLIATDDNILFTMIYLHFVEGLRPDVDLILQGVGSADLPPLKFNPDVDPVFLTHHPNWNIPSLALVPVGLTFRAWRAGTPDPPLLLPGPALDGENDPRVPKEYLTQNLIGQFHYMLGVTFEERDWLRAREEFLKAGKASPDNDVLFFNLGLIYLRNGLYDDSMEAFRRSDAINPRNIASASKASASEKLAAVEAERSRVAAIESALAAAPDMGGLAPESPEGRLRLSRLLDARGEGAAARGERLKAMEAEAAPGGDSRPSPR